ncbi:MAG: hypothetical protein LBV79_06130 [Candidatus Adiutrix sp.]|jgi:hypothetical protein|nr:hypothetical protein [Candidatus Adiutrix sp.]
MRKILLCAAMLSLCAFSGTAQADPSEVCATADFKTFVEKFMTLSAADQYSCVKYPARHLFDEERQFQDPNQLQEFLGEGKFVFAPEDFDSPEDVSTPYLSASDPNEIQPAKSGYVYTQEPEGMRLSMANGGTSVMNVIRWEQVDGYWMAAYFTGWIDD